MLRVMLTKGLRGSSTNRPSTAYSLATEVHIIHTSLVGLALRTDLAERIIGAAIVTVTVEEGHELVELPLALVREVLQRRRRRCRRGAL